MSANLARCFAESEWAERMREELEPYQQQYLSSDEHYTTSAELTYLTYHTNPAVQFGVVCGRTFKNLIRNPRTSFLQVMCQNFTVKIC